MASSKEQIFQHVLKWHTRCVGPEELGFVRIVPNFVQLRSSVLARENAFLIMEQVFNIFGAFVNSTRAWYGNFDVGLMFAHSIHHFLLQSSNIYALAQVCCSRYTFSLLVGNIHPPATVTLSPSQFRDASDRGSIAICISNWIVSSQWNKLRRPQCRKHGSNLSSTWSFLAKKIRSTRILWYFYLAWNTQYVTYASSNRSGIIHFELI